MTPILATVEGCRFCVMDGPRITQGCAGSPESARAVAWGLVLGIIAMRKEKAAR